MSDRTYRPLLDIIVEHVGADLARVVEVVDIPKLARSGADLRHADLYGANLRHADLSDGWEISDGGIARRVEVSK